MKSSLFLLLAALSWAGWCSAQTVVNTGGHRFAGHGVEIVYSIGETAILSVEGGGGLFTQGLLQPEAGVEGPAALSDRADAAGQLPEQPVRLAVYPNPVGDRLHVDTDHAGPLSFHILNAGGRIAAGGRHDGQPLELGHLAAGAYWLQLFTADRTFSNAVKFIKQ